MSLLGSGWAWQLPSSAAQYTYLKLARVGAGACVEPVCGVLRSGFTWVVAGWFC